MSTGRISPYERLRRKFAEFASKVEHPRRRAMWCYPKDKLDSGWALSKLYERTKAAEQIGYDVQLVATDDELQVQYVEKRPAAPPEAFR